jgi:hypothetical protein
MSSCAGYLLHPLGIMKVKTEHEAVFTFIIFFREQHDQQHAFLASRTYQSLDKTRHTAFDSWTCVGYFIHGRKYIISIYIKKKK